LKLDARQVAGFLRAPGATRMALLHGEDEGLLRERAQALTRRVAGSLNDPFLVVELTREGWGRIPAEMAALSMIGGRRVIVVRDATDAVLGLAQEALRGPGGAMLILEAAGLGRGKLRSFAESAADAASIACYAEEGQALTGLITSLFADLKVTADPDATAWLSQVVGGDRAVIRGEVEKLALLAGPERRVDIDMARQCVGEAASAAGDDAILAASLGDLTGSDTAMEAALADGLNGVALLRMATGHLQKLHQARLRMLDGQSAAEAVRAMRPPVFYKATAAMTTALGLWSADSLLRAIEEARRAELACKQTGSRPELLARRFVQSVARAAWRRT
jgi:DNA polymerase-3 subunit delta